MQLKSRCKYEGIQSGKQLSLAKDHSWAEHHTSLLKRRMGALSSVSSFKKRVLAPYAEKEQTSMEDSTPSTSQSSPCSKSHVDEFTAEATETNLLF